jgi:hypothetical protein
VLILTPLLVGIVFAVAWRQSASGAERRVALITAGLALAARAAATLVIYMIARQTHGEGTWLSDEASFWLATESLLPNPLDRDLPLGLDHLAGDGYLGLTTTIALAFGAADSNAFRLTNAAIGAIVVVLAALQARRLFGTSAGMVAGVVLGLWPTLVLWSATFLRDTLGSFGVIALWWALGSAREIGRARMLAVAFLSLVMLFTLRPYLATAALIGVAAWAGFPIVRRLNRRTLLATVSCALLVAAIYAVVQPRRLDFAVHELVYRQTVTRIETLGLLYTDLPPEASNLPIKPGTAVAVADPHTGWLLTGVVQDMPRSDSVRVAFVDQSIRTVPLDDVMRLESAPIPPLQLAAWVGPNLAAFLVGTSLANDGSSVVWVFGSIAWDVLAILALAGCIRRRASPAEWLFPLCVVGGTVLAQVAVPGAPGNVDRHLSTQTLPFLVVFATGVASLGAARFDTVRSMIIRPSTQATAINSRMRSAR